MLTSACAEEGFEQSQAFVEADDDPFASIGEDGTVRFRLDEQGRSFALSCGDDDPFCGLTLEMGLFSTFGAATGDDMTPSDDLREEYGIRLETYGPQSFNEGGGEVDPSFAAEVPAADLVGSSRRFGEIGVAHGGTLRFDLEDPWGLLTEGTFGGVDVELKFPLCRGGTSFCE